MSKLGVNRENQKKTNRGLVMKLIATQQCSSRVELARRMGLTKTAITQIVNELLEKDLLVETKKETTAEMGRNPVGLGISPHAPLFAGILIGRGGCEGVICDITLNIRHYEMIEGPWDYAVDLEQDVINMADKLLAYGEEIRAIGVASIGPVDVKEGRILHPLYFGGVGDIPIRSLLEERYHLPVIFDHDNQSAVLAEHLYGNGRDYQDILLVSVGEGVGCGILVNGRRIHSYTGFAPEIGHISINYQGVPCPCGNIGCLERYVNSSDSWNKLKYITGKNLPYEQLVQMNDDPLVDSLMKDLAKQLSVGIISTLNVLNSQIVLLSMDCVYWPDKYISILEEEINRKKYGNTNVHIPVKKVRFRQQTQVLGAAVNAINQLFYGEWI